MPASEGNKLSAALLATMRPIAAMLLRFGIGYREFADLCKTAFVQAATDEFGIRGRRTNVSRVAAMTGLTRKEVRRIRDLALADALPPVGFHSAPSEVLHRWYTDPVFTTGPGQPRLLAYDGPSPSFVELVRSCAGDIPPGAIRAELRRVGGLVERADGLLEARRRYYVPDAPAERLMEGVNFGLRPLAGTVAHNVRDDAAEDRRFQRIVQNRFVPVERKPEVEAGLRARLTEFSEEIDDYFSEVETPGRTLGCSIGVGLYYFEESPNEAAQPSASSSE